MVAQGYKDADKIIDRLLSSGYREFPPNPICAPRAMRAFQKRICDEYGDRIFFLDVYMYEPITHPHTGETWGPTFEIEAQLYQKDTHNAVNLDFLSEWNEADAENFIMNMFKAGMLDKYDDR